MVGERVWLIKINIVCMAGAWQALLTRRGKEPGVWMLQIRIAMVTRAGSRILLSAHPLRGVRGDTPRPGQNFPRAPATSQRNQGEADIRGGKKAKFSL